MNYIRLETNSLVTVVGRNKDGKIDWHRMGTSADLINLSDIKLSRINTKTDQMAYVLPVMNLDSAYTFKNDCLKNYGIDVQIINEQEAKDLIANLNTGV
jgi:hypothetical protein